jgi:hypothetical protein
MGGWHNSTLNTSDHSGQSDSITLTSPTSAVGNVT